MISRFLTGAFLLLLLSGSQVLAQQPEQDTLDVVNWNLEYFGDPGHHNPATQINGVRQIMNGLNADIYAICEVVQVDSFFHLAQSLNGNYSAVISDYGSFAASPSASGYASAQKLGLIYRSSMLRNVSTRPMLASSQNAYYSFSSGRFPFQVMAEVLGRDSLWRPLSFIVMHAKAYTDANACSRRINGCKELKDSLDLYYANAPFLLLGDFNDDLDISNCGGGASNYELMVSDSGHYKSLTLPISKAGAFSIDGYSSLIDHVIASDEMYRYYLPGSAATLRDFVKNLVPNYDNLVSDHFPVLTRYVLDQQMHTEVPALAATGKLRVYPNPARSHLNLDNPGLRYQHFALYRMNGQKMTAGDLHHEKEIISLEGLPSGLYVLAVRDRDGHLAWSQVTLLP